MWKEKYSLVKVQHNDHNSTTYERPLHLTCTVNCNWSRFTKLVKDIDDLGGQKPNIDYDAEKEKLTIVIPNIEGLKIKESLTRLLS